MISIMRIVRLAMWMVIFTSILHILKLYNPEPMYCFLSGVFATLIMMVNILLSDD